MAIPPNATDPSFYEGGSRRPVPDPTILTGQLVDRAVAGLREILEGRLTGQKEVFEARLNGMDEAIRLLQTIADRGPLETQAEIRHLQDVLEERFRTVAEQFKTVTEQFVGVQTQFLERDVRVRESALAATTAINAALQSQKEAAGEQAKSFTLSIDKSEKGTLEQIAQQRVLLETTTKGIGDKIDDLKDRLTRIEGMGIGSVAAKGDQHTATADSRASGQFVLAMILGGISLVGFVILLMDKIAIK